MRAALLTEHKYVALVNNFGDSESTINALEAEGAMNLRSIYNSYFNKTTGRPHNSLRNPLNSSSAQGTDSVLEHILQSKQEDEVLDLYPQTFEYNKRDEIPNENEVIDKVDFKKSLTQTMEEDSDLDYRRTIDPSFGVVALREYIPATKLKGMEDWIPESEHYKYYSTATDFPLNIEMDGSLVFPEHLNIFTYEKGNVSPFTKPNRSVTGVLSHFLMDGASILPPLALGIEPGDRVLDACAAPGGKSLSLLQTLYPLDLVSNDLQTSRVERINRIFKDYLIDYEEKWKNKRCFVTEEDARFIPEYEMYDKVLVDVPCTTDRHSVMENDNNIFKTTRIKERLRIPELQSAILSNCIRLLRPGGSLVYSTCTLSPVQNDGVVHMALSQVFRDHNITVTIKDLSTAMRPFLTIYKFENPMNLKYGQLVVPFLPANFGPMYFCKLTRNV
ncbi:5-methylcytosine rRNA methyltransferase NSUN4 [Pseudolycoriella hygida]|uniref:NOL1/NOP2/Sun domain family member 4 n=1 Tax=Pseudolycoriella hygida TaxID=35572 RepID=A0A9Q0NI00_9DIPT|nr:5-methylcytosine rRNA methyltransferase NSUN4 [Pseudolycoriella hygida]